VQRAHDIYALLRGHAFIYEQFFLHFYTDSLFGRCIPKEWQPLLTELNESQARDLPRKLKLNLDSPPPLNSIPSSLRHFIEEYRRIRLHRQLSSFSSSSSSSSARSGSVDRIGSERAKEGAEISGASDGRDKNDLGVWLSMWMKPKKKHEVSLMSHRIAETMRDSGCSTILDIGSGEGYLSRVLTYSLGFNVVAIDGNASFSERAKQRTGTLTRYLRDHAGPAELSEQYKDGTAKLLHLEGFIDPTMDSAQLTAFLDPLVQAGDVTHDDLARLGLVGLHCCGDLTPTMIKMFLSSSTLKTLVVAGCCYFKMKGCKRQCGNNKRAGAGYGDGDGDAESQSSDNHTTTWKGGNTVPIYEAANFPLSQYVRSFCEGFPHGALRAACESIDTWETQTEDELDYLQHDAWRRFYLEYLVSRNRELFSCDCSSFLCAFIRLSSVANHHLLKKAYKMKGFNTKVTDFAEYCSRAIPKLHFKQSHEDARDCQCAHPGNHAKHVEYLISLTKDNLITMQEQGKADLGKIRAMYALRCMAGELIEDFIAIDRLIFLLEHEGIDASLEPIFDASMSPRNLVLVANKR
jgi:hypothetical protein